MTSRDALLERPLPHNSEAERAILGGILLDNDLMSQAAAELGAHPDILYVRAHQLVFAAMLDLYQENQPITPITVGEKLRTAGFLEQVGGVAFISELTYGLPHFSNLATYARIVREKYIYRRAIKAANKITSQALDEEDTPAQLLGDAEQMFIALRELQAQGERADSTLADIGGEARAFIESIERGESPAIPTGIEEIDRRTRGGIHPEQFWFVVAMEKQGKTALLHQILRNIARRGDEAVLFSFEMSALETYMRFASSMSGVPMYQIDVGIGDEQLYRLKSTLPDVDALPITINTTASNITEARARVREYQRRAAQRGRRLAVVGFDYAQLMEGRANVAIENRVQEIEFIVRTMKRIAAEFKIGVIALAQFNNRAGEEVKVHGRPTIMNVHGGGEIRKACDVGMVLHTVAPKKSDKGIRAATLYIDLQRNAPPAVVPLILDSKTLEFFPRRDGKTTQDIAREGDDSAGETTVAAPPPAESDDPFGDDVWK